MKIPVFCSHPQIPESEINGLHIRCEVCGEKGVVGQERLETKEIGFIELHFWKENDKATQLLGKEEK